MRVKEKKVYYCEFCTKYKLSRVAMEKHERHCTLNPNRICRWAILDYSPYRKFKYAQEGSQLHGAPRALPRWLRMNRPITEDVISKLRDYCNGCPACMLAAIRQAKLDFMGNDYKPGHDWRYEDEVKRYREDEREHQLWQEHRDIESTFL